jgi:hypothetical protein
MAVDRDDVALADAVRAEEVRKPVGRCLDPSIRELMRLPAAGTCPPRSAEDLSVRCTPERDCPPKKAQPRPERRGRCAPTSEQSGSRTPTHGRLNPGPVPDGPESRVVQLYGQRWAAFWKTEPSTTAPQMPKHTRTHTHTHTHTESYLVDHSQPIRILSSVISTLTSVISTS